MATHKTKPCVIAVNGLWCGNCAAVSIDPTAAHPDVYDTIPTQFYSIGLGWISAQCAENMQKASEGCHRSSVKIAEWTGDHFRFTTFTSDACGNLDPGKTNIITTAKRISTDPFGGALGIRFKVELLGHDILTENVSVNSALYQKHNLGGAIEVLLTTKEFNYLKKYLPDPVIDESTVSPNPTMISDPVSNFPHMKPLWSKKKSSHSGEYDDWEYDDGVDALAYATEIYDFPKKSAPKPSATPQKHNTNPKEVNTYQHAQPRKIRLNDEDFEA